ncbi:MAG: RNA polymerase sigma factor [Eubacterium sp.]
MEDIEIIEMYWARNEQAIEETDLKYGKLCKQLARNILFNLEDVEEVMNETYLGVWNTIPPNRPKYLKTFVCKITKNIAMAKVRYYHADKRRTEGMVSLDEIEDIVSGKNNIEEEYEKKEISGFISEYLRMLDMEKRNIFLNRYWYHNSMAEIAEIYGISESKVKTTLFRTRRKLKEYLKNKGVEL